MIARITSTSCLTILLCITGFAHASEPQQPPRIEDRKEAIVLRVGIPTATTPERARESERYKELLSRLAQWPAARKAELFVDVAFGSEYQVLEWLERGEVDAALLPPFAAYQLGPSYAPGSPAESLRRLDGYSCYPGLSEAPTPPAPLPIRAHRFDGVRWSVEPGNADLYIAFLQEVARAAADPPRATGPHTRLALPSHLSEEGLFGPLATACDWIEDEQAHPKIDKGKFWEKYFARTRFLLGAPAEQWRGDANPPSPGVSGTSTILEFGPQTFPLDAGLLVVPDRVKDEVVSAGLLENDESFVSLAEHSRIAAYGKRIEGSACLRRILKKLFYAGGPQGARSAKFTLPELHRLIRRDMETSRSDALALVLPGGGVKAAYQTIVVDHLYEHGYLTNVREYEKHAPRSEPPADPYDLVVRLVTANSGGALIGSFVASLAGPPLPVLSELLWVNDEGDPLDSSDVFPFWDLPRWFTIIVAGVVLLLGLEIWAFFARRWSARFKMMLAHSHVADNGGRWLDSVVWLAFLFVIPVGFKYLNGPFGTEHVPAVAGAVYFLAVCLAILGDSCSVIHKLPSGKSPERKRYRALFLASLTLGLALILIPVVARYAWPGWVTPRAISTSKMPAGSILFCVGVFPMLGAYIFWVLDRPGRYGKTKLKNFVLPLTSLAFGCTIPVLAYAILGLLRLTGMLPITYLELTGSFWKAFLPLTAALTVLAVAFGAWCGRTGRGRARVYEAMTYLVTRHPTRSMRIHHLARMMLVFVVCWCWWNVIVGPALYGNDLAEAYICGSARRFVEKAGQAEPSGQQAGGATPSATRDGTGEDRCAGSVDLQADFVAPANSLDRNEERYFLYTPELGPPLKPLVNLHGDSLHLGPLWRCPPPSLLYKVIFASGSPFPIFPAHQIDYGKDAACTPKPGAPEAREAPEWLVDGGFAHNIPIEAAKLMGARQLLVLKSTPEPPVTRPQSEAAGEAGVNAPHESILGPLVKNLPRLVPFLYERAQVADVLSMEGLFVVSISPSGDPSDWPVLYDFRDSVVRKMKEEATLDLRRRIGRVESWGSPAFRRVMHAGEPIE